MDEEQQNPMTAITKEEITKPKKKVCFSETTQVFIIPSSSSSCLEVIKMDIPIKKVKWRKRIRVYSIPSRTELKRYCRSLWYCNEEIQQMENEAFELYKFHTLFFPHKN